MNKKGIALLTIIALVLVGIFFMILRRPAPLVIEPAGDSPSSLSMGATQVGSQGQPINSLVVEDAQSPAATARDREQAVLFDQVIAARNDNDPRLDSELRVLAPGARALLRQRYSSFAPEKRNERGTTVFLLGRNLETPEDFEFLGQVLSEAPCRSLENCERDSPAETAENAHHDIGVEVTLAYPQIVALKSLERLLASPTTEPGQLTLALAKLRVARDSKVRRVSEMAESLLKQYQAKSGSH